MSLPSKPLSTQASMPWHPQPHHVIAGQAGVRCSKKGRSTARASTAFAFLRESFVLLHGKRATLPFWQERGEGSFKKPCWEEPGIWSHVYSTYREV